MTTKKGNKKGFWASLFSPKPCSCSCDDNLIIEESAEPATLCACEGGTAATQTEVKEIKVLGPGCSKCKTALRTIEKVIHDHHLDVKLIKVDDMAEIVSYKVMATPAIVVDGVVRIKGHAPSESEVRQMLGI
ncbi:MAG: thioredoxin family protein [Bacteroides sp.]|nr:thioredoxin family protein [Bacteroides sp.]MCM1085606.1 thioredoxin family protein [Bacteroides sp.]